jgi:NAD(P)-dependent dehydrogenase (short-subunit alcohol dehydrogenase family)
MASEDLSRRRVVVTGGASGIGLAAVRCLAAQGVRVALVDRVISSASADFSEITEWHRDVDVTDEAAVELAFDDIAAHFDGIDAVIHAAGVMREQMTDPRDVSLAAWNEVLGVNLTGAFLVSRAAARIMAAQGSGTIVLVGSHAGTIGPSGSVPYGASKGGVNGLAMTLHRFLSPLGIRVNNLCPGSVDTPLVRRSLDEGVAHGASTEVTERTRKSLVDPDGVGRILAFLAGPDADLVQGTVFTS